MTPLQRSPPRCNRGAPAFSARASRSPRTLLLQPCARARGSWARDVRARVCVEWVRAAQIDLDNDEVRIYLTSSQELLQQDDVARLDPRPDQTALYIPF